MSSLAADNEDPMSPYIPPVTTEPPTTNSTKQKSETAAAALENELLQETGLRLEGTPAFHGVFHNNGVSRRDHVLVYVCNVNGSVAIKPTSVEIAEVGYFDLDDLPEGTDPGTIRRMREVIGGIEPRLEW